MSKRGPHNPAITWHPHVQLSWGGTLGTSAADIWTSGVKYVYADPNKIPTFQEMEDILGPLTNVVSGWFAGGNSQAKSFISQDAKLTWVKANSVLANGLQADLNTHVVDFAPIPGAEAVQVPWYQTVALTWRTGVKRGRAHSGRMFPPLVTAQPEAGSPYIAAGNANMMASWAQSHLISLINDRISELGTQIGHCAVLSPGNTAKGTTPLVQIITGVAVDRVPDVQHRRTNRVQRLEGGLAIVP